MPVPLVRLKDIAADPGWLNRHGGAIALGHALRASGARACQRWSRPAAGTVCRRCARAAWRTRRPSRGFEERDERTGTVEVRAHAVSRCPARRCHAQGRRATEAAAKLTVPTLLLAGADSDVVRKEDILRFQALAPGAEIRYVNGTGHMVIGDRNDRFTKAIGWFLAKIWLSQL